MKSANVRLTLALVAILFTTVVVRSVFTYRSTTQILASHELVVHTYQVLSELDLLSSHVQELEMNLSDRRSSSSTAVLRQALSGVDSEIAKLREMTSDNPRQQDRLNGLVSGKMRLQEVIDSASPAAASGTFADTVRNLSHGLLNDVEQMKTDEIGLLQPRSKSAEDEVLKMRQGIVIAVIAIALMVLLVGYNVVGGERRKAEAVESRLKLAGIVDFSDDAIISKTLDGKITSWNRGAESLYGYTAAEMIGRSVYDIVPPELADEMKNIFATIDKGERVNHLETIRITKDGRKIDIDLIVSPIKDGSGKLLGASAIGRDISSRKRQEESIRELTARILQAQDEERRRIARDLHDTTVQKLAIISMNLSQLAELPALSEDEVIRNCRDLNTDCIQELRSLSYLLHPPMLDELGLPSALRIFAEGFAKRSNVDIDVDTPSQWSRLSHDAEVALFRVAQESLTNVMRHSGSKTATIRLHQNSDTKMEIVDSGKGMPAGSFTSTFTSQIGVGIAGMRERLRQIGGTLEVESSSRGTLVRATVSHARETDG